MLKPIVRRALKYFFCAILIAGLATLAIVLLSPKPPRPPLPNPNGYDDFLKASAMLIGKPEDYEAMTKKELATLVATNAEALKILRIGLTHQCLVPDLTLGTSHARELRNNTMPLRRLALLIYAEGKLAETNGQPDEAAKIYFDCIQYGHGIGHDGGLLPRIIGGSCENLAVIHLAQLINGLSATKCAEIARSLETVDAKAEPAQVTLANQNAYYREFNGWWRQTLLSIELYKFNRENDKKFRNAINMQTLFRRQTILAFAARAFELEKGHRPQSTADLVPAYLKAIPKDPVTGTNIVYRP
jgi:hypothetical protein